MKHGKVEKYSCDVGYFSDLRNNSSSSNSDRTAYSVPCIRLGEIQQWNRSAQSECELTNLNTTENYTVETNASSNYYQVITSSCNVSEGDVLYFNASDGGNSINRTVTVTSENMTEGGLFEQNLTIKVGICGDVDGSGRVDMADYFLLVDYIAEVPGREPENMWAADVDCSDRVDMADYFLLVDYIAEVPGRELNCC